MAVDRYCIYYHNNPSIESIGAKKYYLTYIQIKIQIQIPMISETQKITAIPLWGIKAAWTIKMHEKISMKFILNTGVLGKLDLGRLGHSVLR